jgi:hypothetical protein
MLSAFFLSTAGAAPLVDLEDMKSPPTTPHSGAATLLRWDDGSEENPPTRPHVEREKRRMTDALIALHLLYVLNFSRIPLASIYFNKIC